METPNKIVIFKFGGTSASSLERIIESANCIQAELEKGNWAVPVWSAMKWTSDTLPPNYKNFLSSYEENTDEILKIKGITDLILNFYKILNTNYGLKNKRGDQIFRQLLLEPHMNLIYKAELHNDERLINKIKGFIKDCTIKAKAFSTLDRNGISSVAKSKALISLGDIHL